MAEQLVGQRRPGAGEHPPPGRLAHAGAQRRVGHQPGHRARQVVGLARRHQVAGGAVVHQVDRPARGGRDDRQPAGGRLLDGLAEGLERPGVHEDVERGVDPGQVLAVAHAEELGRRQRRPQLLLHRAAPGDRQLDPGERGHRGQQVDPLLDGQAPHVADDHLAVRCQLAPQPLVAQVRAEPAGVDAAAPLPDPLEPVCVEVGRGGAGRGEGAAGRVVDVAQPAPGERLGRPAQVVRASVARQVGLVDGDGRHVLGPGDPGAPRAQGDRAGQVDHLGAVLHDGAAGLRGRQTETEGRVTRQRHRRHPLDRVGEVAVRGGAPGLRGDDQWLVALADEVLRHSYYAVRDAVHIRGERLRDDGDPHAPKIAVRPFVISHRACRRNERRSNS